MTKRRSGRRARVVRETSDKLGQPVQPAPAEDAGTRHAEIAGTQRADKGPERPQDEPPPGGQATEPLSRDQQTVLEGGRTTEFLPGSQKTEYPSGGQSTGLMSNGRLTEPPSGGQTTEPLYLDQPMKIKANGEPTDSTVPLTDERLMMATPNGTATLTASNGSTPPTLDNSSEMPAKTTVSGEYVVQLGALALSSKVFVYESELAKFQDITTWCQDSDAGPLLYNLQIRAAAGSFILGNTHRANKTSRRLKPNSVLASSAGFSAMQSALTHIALFYNTFDPIVAHIAAIELATDNTSVVDFVSPLTTARDSGWAIVSSTKPDEMEHMVILSTLLAEFIPTCHLYDGVMLSKQDVHHAISAEDLHLTYSRLYAKANQKPPLKVQNKIAILTRVVQVVNEEFNTAYAPFEYQGNLEAETIFMIFGAVDRELASTIIQANNNTGLINTRIVLPQFEEDLLSTLPRSAKRIIVLDQINRQGSREGTLFALTLANVFRPELIPNLDLVVTQVPYPVGPNMNLAKLAGLVEEPLSTSLRELLSVDKETNDLPYMPSPAPQEYETYEQEPPSSFVTDWRVAAHQLMFKEAHAFSSPIRPDLPVQNYCVRVQENRRLTPVYYDRNIFHIEFDISGTGMTYNIGEALGIHAYNDKTAVSEFIEFYNLDPDKLVISPSRENIDLQETRTVYQIVQQNLDLFGKPAKKFYQTLSAFATDEKDEKVLLTLSASEGTVEFKRRMDVEMVTYFDLLKEFPSARPSFEELMAIVPPIKRREYSIASSQKVHPLSVHLLVVEVAWRDPLGRDRYGQATRYLSQLPIGTHVTVSVKPSMMKLPPRTELPIIMAGLGTGLAPFRAFIQHRAWQKLQGASVGKVLLYMGSRHQREEYLYGEEWEAYRDAGVITLLKPAFSRDQKEKIYIQDRMRETLPQIVDALIKEGGSFYLCGPTWPVPDVQDVLQSALAQDALNSGFKGKYDSKRAIEKLKDVGRFVLEVY